MIRHLAMAVLTLFGSVASYTTAKAIDEVDVPRRFLGELVPFVMSFKRETFKGVGGIEVSYRAMKRPGATDAIVLVPGYSEAGLKYAELMFDFAQLGYNVYAIDLRGMGESQRLLANPQIGHVEEFADYVKDLEDFFSKIVKPQETGRVFLFAHSMGALVAVMAMANHPSLVQAAVLSSPMFGINTGRYPKWLAHLIVWFQVIRGAGDEYVPGAGDYQVSQDNPAHSNVTHSLLRAGQTSELYKRMPQLRIWGQSNRWVLSSFRATSQSAELAPRLTVPLLVLAAQDEQMVALAAEEEFCSRAPQCQMMKIVGGRHEVMQEVDSIRGPALKAMADFFKRHVTKP